MFPFKKTMIMIALLACVVSFSACATNQQVMMLRDQQNETFAGLMDAYDEAIKRMRIERIGIENQFIDEQLARNLVENVLFQKTNITMEQLRDTPVISMTKIESFETARKARIAEINEEYAKLDQAKETFRAQWKMINDAIQEIDQERAKTERSFWDAVKGLIGFGAGLIVAAN